MKLFSRIILGLFLLTVFWLTQLNLEVSYAQAQITQVTLSANSFSFGNVAVGTLSSDQNLKITNTGTTSVAVITGALTGPFRISQNFCDPVLGWNGQMAPGTHCDILLAFAPTGSGNATGTFSVSAGTQTHSISLNGTGVTTAPPPPPPTTPINGVVMIDLASDRGPMRYRASGFIHALAPTIPSDALVVPMKAQVFRGEYVPTDQSYGNYANYSRIRQLGATSQIVMSDSFGYSSGVFPGDNGNWGSWDSIVSQFVNGAKSRGEIHQWDIWNEPNLSQFWARSQQQFFDLWKRTVQQIRSIDPNAVIVGPSSYFYDYPYLTQFLIFARDNGVLPNIVSWHELQPGTLDPATIPGNVAQIRTFLANNFIPNLPIQLNEIVPVGYTLEPGPSVVTFANIERAQVDSSVKSCWTEPSGVDTCYSLTLNGLLTPNTRQPRPLWWAHKAYGDIAGRIVSVAPNNGIDGVVGKDSAQSVVRGVFGSFNTSSQNIELRFTDVSSASYIASSGVVQVLVKKMSNSIQPLSNPVTVINANYTISNNEARVVIPGFEARAAYSIELKPGTPPPSPVLVGDLNRDKIVNSLDWSIMNNRWFTNDANADLNRDGLVNAIDFSLLNANWFRTIP